MKVLFPLSFVAGNIIFVLMCRRAVRLSNPKGVK